ncbi:FAD binding domain-containing protein [Acetomicrobium sp.]|uniref:FAD binding domain-containing protein n=1 Tax=Acetomicrobium sp. TaxID=1872099 RepID=UPI001BD0C6C4|nr:FAD binding domain-containing protein [Acetomicrobium sp.]
MKLRFTLNGQEVTVEASPLDRLLDVLREQLGYVGTKEGCGEGECGACSVILNGKLVNSCLVPALQVRGGDVLTIEGLDGEEDALQKAFVEEGAVQCGFCIPGMVLAARALLSANPNPTREEIKWALAGNLCRCTGYERIFRAVEKAAAEGYGRKIAAEKGRRDNVSEESVKLQGSEISRVFLPDDLEEALEILERYPNVTLLSGCTDFYPDLKKGKPEPERVMDIWNLKELKGIKLNEGYMEIGSGTTFSKIAFSDLVKEHFPALAYLSTLIGAVAIQNRATIGGNLVNGSAAADSPPLLFVLGAIAVLQSKRGVREIPVTELYSGYRKTVLRPDELLKSVKIPLPSVKSRQFFYKRGSRLALTISRLSVAGFIELDGKTVDDVRLAAGSMSPVPIFLTETKKYLRGKKLTEEVIDEARLIASEEVSPRTSKDYRKRVTGRLVSRFLKEARS